MVEEGESGEEEEGIEVDDEDEDDDLGISSPESSPSHHSDIQKVSLLPVEHISVYQNDNPTALSALETDTGNKLHAVSSYNIM